MKRLKYSVYALCASAMLSMSSCFNLDETPYSEIVEEEYVPTEADEVALLATTYSKLRYVMDWYGLFDLQEEPGDVIVTPTRPNGWDDGGTYKQMHKHTWDNQQGQPQSTWSVCFEGIANANKILKRADEGFFSENSKPKIVAEVRAIRALWYSILCDTHGNVPIQTTFSEDVPNQSTRKEVFDFIIKELTEVMPELSSAVDKTTYGRLTQWGAKCLMARMYLNAEVYTGTPMWNECLQQCDEIINSNLFKLESKYTDIFKTDNAACVETIFAIPYDEVYNSGDNNGPVFGAHMKFLSSNSRKVFNMQSTPWGGSAANPQFINSYDKNDMRLKYSWLQGDQYSPDGVLITTFPNKLPSIYNTGTDDGYRIGKYEIKIGAKSLLSNDFPYFRYAEVLLMKAECLLRLGQNEAEAANLVSQIRERAFSESAHPEKATVDVAWLKGDTHIQYGTLDENGNIDAVGNTDPVEFGGLYDEWGWEFAAEGRRRIDMIRFGTFQKKSWFNHVPTENDLKGNSILFPIHLEDLNKNPNLQQNPGYAGR
ncbi:MAG: RagB/SusD family nutrient uptake outer membrane protein [Phocaeicola sp.]|uniref:RagB/SusD family nutrient uptake outer membrane protein n=1 Tax=Phocaeicola sp. TaxID=2773926 RepID=UPI003FA07B15